MTLPDKPADHPRSMRWCSACQATTLHEFICGAWRCTEYRYHVSRIVWADGTRYWWDLETGELIERPKKDKVDPE